MKIINDEDTEHNIKGSISIIIISELSVSRLKEYIILMKFRRYMMHRNIGYDDDMS
jgi:hypothetical protein